VKLGLAGLLTRYFIASPLTPLLLLASLAAGALALGGLSREEEPQISVPMVDIHVEAPGLKAVDAAELVTKPLEDIVKAINGVEHVYSQTLDGHVVVTARFFVGTDEDTAILRVHEKIRANMDRIPLGVPEPLIVGRGINDVAIVTLTLSPRADLPDAALARWNDNALYDIAEKLQHELVKVPDIGLTYLVGGRPDEIRVQPDPERLALYGVTLSQLVDKVQHANTSLLLGALRQNDSSLPVAAGQTLQGIPDVGLLLVTTRDGRPVYVKDVADVVVGGKPVEHQAWNLVRQANGELKQLPAVTLALAKRKGANAVDIAAAILTRLDLVQGRIVPRELSLTVTRDYGATANDKVNELLFHLALATVSIVLLITLAIGWREGVVVFIVIPTTILLTLFASWLMGYTINRVSLFALIFSIGILVDDAIVVVENIDRHWAMADGRGRLQAAIDAVGEVGNPTIVATLTVIAALLPMMFVSGLMGPYMSPIPANASVAMLFSFFIAVVVTPWLMLRLSGRAGGGHAPGGGEAGSGGRLGTLYRRIARPLLTGRRRSWIFLLLVGGATIAACSLFYGESVVVKLLPFDNKSEVQVVIDLPHGSSLEATQRLLRAAADRLASLPEMTSIQAYAGTAAPFNFNGLVRHYYLRGGPEQGDLQINLLPKGQRDRPSHAIALDIRKRLADLAKPPGTALEVIEVPPGPPVLATLLVEVYGSDAATRRAAAARLRQAFGQVDFIVDVDDTAHRPAERLRFEIDHESLEFHGVQEQAVYDTIGALIGGVSVGYSHRGEGTSPIEIAIRLPKQDLFLSERMLATPVPAPGPAGGQPRVVELGDLVKLTTEQASYQIFRRDGRDAEMVTGELAGRFEAPIYGMIAAADEVAKQDWGPGGPPAFHLHGQPADESKVSFLWDGEWEITYVTFRDMGMAFGAALLGIYLLIVAQFRSFKLPLLILVPVPLTLIGILLGHWLLGAAFTATSMIGFIALAGIIVRNSILLVDFIRQRQLLGHSLRDCLIEAGAVRFKPIFLTAAAAMIGAGFILSDPIFQGLAISLVFGLASSTALTVLVVPAVYVVLRDDGRSFGTTAQSQRQGT
jgi:multidrug efflux pump subunit AcrB